MNSKQQQLANSFSKMNDMQKDAIFNVNGPLLILAGAGSGKTTVLVNRIANMINYGNAYFDDNISDLSQCKPINPWNILAITFTNKAATELKERLEKMLGAEVALKVNAGTFHSICAKILRREISVLGYNSNFTIYDTDDSVKVIKSCLEELNLDDKVNSPKALLSIISKAKDSLTSPKDYLIENENNVQGKISGNVYTIYQRKLKESNALDFDDIIVLTVKLLKENPDVLEHYQNLYKYVLVDEYQDTNHAQYMLVSLLSGKYKNLCVVGDDDQSIYKFRGATIENILSFEKEFKDAKVIRLEQNYRSTQNILDAANSVIKNNTARKGKNLWTDNGEGDKIVFYKSPDEEKESAFIIKKISEDVVKGEKFSDHSILYRMNAQSANIEHQLVRAGIPYKIVGSKKFYERKEIKDIVSYLQVINNPNDSVRLHRIINEPKRGIGETTIKHIEDISASINLSMYDVMKNAASYPKIAKKSAVLSTFVAILEDLFSSTDKVTVAELFDNLLDKTGYITYLKTQGKDGENRIENVNELKSNIIKYELENENATLAGFLEEIALYTDLDNLNSSDDSVVLMTIHSAKGLEFNNVFLIGMEEGIFPSYNATYIDEELEEERRLAYVALTRAKQHLYLSNATQRMMFGRTARNLPSRFLKEIPVDLISVIDDTVKSYGYTPRPEKPKPVYKPEIKGSVGVVETPKKATIDFSVGDSVQHSIFGIGNVVSMKPMGNDTLVEINFDKAGKKKIMANFAKLEKM